MADGDTSRSLGRMDQHDSTAHDSGHWRTHPTAVSLGRPHPTSLMTRLLSCLVALAFVVSGCDAAGPDRATADLRGEGSPGSCSFSIAGPGSLGQGQTATYSITSANGCLLQDSDWNAGLGATVVSSDETTAQIQAGSWTNSFQITVNVTYYEGYVLAIREISRTVSITP